jgi:hypothetical protein
MEKCVKCEGVYTREDSDSSQSSAFCSLKCEISFRERMNEPIKFI